MKRNHAPAQARLFDRRKFLVAGGMATAASALGLSLASCNNYTVEIPCLGPAAAPTPIPGMTYIRASEIGCALDCDLGTGCNKHTGGTATDDGPRINAAMANASADHPITLIMDGSALISGLFLSAEGYWGIAGLGCGTGFFIKAGTNNDGIHNGPPNAAVPSNPGPPAPARGKNVSLSNFTLNGDQNKVSTTGMRQGTDEVWYFGINLMNLDNISVENVVIVNTPAYHMRFTNVGDVEVSGCIMISAGENTDGLHFDGPANDVTISNCQFETGDDAIALNCPEGYSGNISRVTVTGCTFESWTLMRLYTAGSPEAQFTIDNVNVNNCSGTLAQSAFLLGYQLPGLPDAIASLTISDCNLTGPDVLGVIQNFGSIMLQNVSFTPSQSGAKWAPQTNKTSAFLRPSPGNGDVGFVGSSVSFHNCTIVRNMSANVAAAVLENEATLGKVEFSGFALQDNGSYSAIGELLNLEGGSVGELIFDSLQTNSIPSPLEDGGFSNVGVVSGAGVLDTRWKFPDTVMADNVPYISETTGRPSIKINGVVEPYSGAQFGRLANAPGLHHNQALRFS